MSIGERIKQARKAAHLTQEQLAQKCGVATITIRQYENEKRKPSIEQIRNISDALRVNWMYLIGYKPPIGAESLEEASKEYEEFQVYQRVKEFAESLVCDIYGNPEIIQAKETGTGDDLYIFDLGEKRCTLTGYDMGTITEAVYDTSKAIIESLFTMLSEDLIRNDTKEETKTPPQDEAQDGEEGGG